MSQAPKVRTVQEKAYDAICKSCVLKPKEHTRARGEAGVTRLYAVTTIASSLRYGGTRTPIILDSFAEARRYVERNVGDLYECSYRLAVIEAVACNRLYSHLEEAYWYLWTYKGESGHEGAYLAIEDPEGLSVRSWQPIG